MTSATRFSEAEAIAKLVALTDRDMKIRQNMGQRIIFLRNLNKCLVVVSDENMD
jgi:hypothetical protein